MIETIQPKDEKHWLEMRRQDVTSTEIAALFGCSPYVTEFELWHRKHDNLEVQFSVNDRMKWGTRLQDSIAAGIAEDYKVKIRRMTEYIRDPELKIGASFDFEYTALDGNRPEGDGILEVKNVDSLAFKDGWLIVGDDVQAPPHIELQVQQQLMLTGKRHAKIGALIGGNRVVLIKREPDPSVIGAIKKRVKEFWESVADHHAPEPNFARDADFIASLYQFAEPGKVYNAGDDKEFAEMVSEYKALGRAAKMADDAKDEIKAKILMKIGESEKVVGDSFSISAGMIGPSHVEYDRKGFRDFKIYLKKAKVAA